MGRILLIAFMVFVSMHAGAAVLGAMMAGAELRAAPAERALE